MRKLAIVVSVALLILLGLGASYIYNIQVLNGSSVIANWTDFGRLKCDGSTVTCTASGSTVTLSASGGGSGTVTSVSGTANQINVATGTTTPVISLPGNAIYESNLANVATDIAGLTSGGTVVIPPGATGTVAATITVGNPNVTVFCQSPAPVFTRAATQTFNMFTVTSAGTGFTLEGCNINMNGDTGLAVLANSGTSNLNILFNNIIGSNGSSAIQMNGTVTALIQGNVITNGIIFGQGNTQNIRVIGNDITNVTASAIEFHSTTASQTVKQLTISSNHLHAEGTFCVEVGSFNGASPTDVTVIGNECDMIGAGSGGYSFGAVIGGAIIGNTFNAGAQTSGIAGIELAPSLVNAASGTQTGCQGGTVSGNTLNGGDISLNESSDVTVTTNTVTIGNGLEAIYMGGSAGLTTASNNVTNNTLICTAQCDTAQGANAIIWLQANNSGEAVSNNIVAQNVIYGSGTGNFETGVYGEDDNGAMTGNQVTQNSYNNMGQGTWFNNAAAVSTVSVYLNTCNTVTTCTHASGTNVSYTGLLVGATGTSVTLTDTAANTDISTSNITPTVTGAATTVALSSGTAPTNPSGNSWVYTLAATESGAGSNAWAGATVTLSGWTGGATGNNCAGGCPITASTTTTVTITNATGSTTNTGTPVMISTAVVSSPLVKIAGTINSGTAGTLNSVAGGFTLQAIPESVAPNPTIGLNIVALGTSGAAHIVAPVGSIAAPTYSFAGSPTTGWYLPSASIIALSTAGTAKLEIGGSTAALISTLNLCWASGNPTSTSCTTSLAQKSSGVLEVGTTAIGDSGTIDATAYQAAGTAGVTQTAEAVGTLATMGGIVTTFTAVSDQRVKANIHPFARGLDAIMALKPASYGFNAEGLKITKYAPDTKQIGFIAQNVRRALPEAVGSEQHDGQNYLSLPQGDRPIVAALVNAVQEQQAEIIKLKKEIARSKKK